MYIYQREKKPDCIPQSFNAVDYTYVSIVLSWWLILVGPGISDCRFRVSYTVAYLFEVTEDQGYPSLEEDGLGQYILDQLT